MARTDSWKTVPLITLTAVAVYWLVRQSAPEPMPVPLGPGHPASSGWAPWWESGTVNDLHYN